MLSIYAPGFGSKFHDFRFVAKLDLVPVPLKGGFLI